MASIKLLRFSRQLCASVFLISGLVACGGSSSGSSPGGGDVVAPPAPEPEPGCTYPDGAPAVMAENAVLPTYRWAESLDFARNNVPLDVENVPCANDANIDWSPFDVLLFVSIPAW